MCAAHRGRSGGEQARGLGGDAARRVGLRDELRAELAAQPQKRRRAEQLDEAPLATGESTEEAAFVRDERRRVQAALEVLTPDERVALELAYYGGLTQSEIAERLDVPLGTVKSRMFAGLAKLRDALE